MDMHLTAFNILIDGNGVGKASELELKDLL